MAESGGPLAMAQLTRETRIVMSEQKMVVRRWVELPRPLAKALARLVIAASCDRRA